MADYKVSIDLSEVLGYVDGPITAAVLPTVHQAVKALAGEAAFRWKNAVSKAKLWNGEKQEYMQSITWKMLTDFSAVVETDYKFAADIETGRPQRDLKKMLDTSLKVRTVTKGKNAGKRYLIIPFRHNTPGQDALATPMPPDIYQKAKLLGASNAVSNGHRASGTGAFGMRTKKAITVPAKSYQWGGRLPAGMSAKLKSYHATDIHAGMVRFKTSAGGINSSAYLTFRVMMEGSPKWIVQAKPGLYLAQAVSAEMEMEAPKVFAAAIQFLK